MAEYIEREAFLYAICYDCLATFSQQEITCEEDLIEAWNRRANDV